MPPKRLFERLPTIWKRWDRDSGFCEDFLDVQDDSFARAHGTVKSILDLRSVDRIPDRYLALVADHVGHVWRSDKGHEWNRRRIRDAIRRWSYKGTQESLADLIREHGGTEWTVVDMASKTIVLGKQGTFGAGNMFFQGADFYHRGAFVLTVDDGIDIEAFKEEFEQIRPGGTRWWIFLATRMLVGCECVAQWQFPTHVAMTNALEHAIGVGQLGSTLCFGGARSDRPWEIRTPTNIQLVAVFGAQIDLADPMVMLTDEDIFLNSGTPDNPLPDEIAGRRAPFEITIGSPEPNFDPFTDVEWVGIWDADQGVTLDESDLASTFADQSGNGHDFLTVPATSRPEYLTNQLNGHAILHSDGTRILSTNAFSWSSDFTIFVVFRATAGYLVLDGYNQIPGMYLNAADAPAVYVDSSEGQQTLNPTNWAMNQGWIIARWEHVDALATLRLFKNGVQVAATASGPDLTTQDFTTQLSIFARWQSAYPVTGDIAFVALACPKLADAVAAQMEQWLATRFGLTLG